MSDEGIALAYDDVTFRYPGSRGDVLSGVSMAVPAGAFALLVGGTGSGKSTLLSLAKPQIAPAGDRAGQVRVFGRPVDDLDGAEACEVGYVFQDPDNQIVCDSVWHEMAFGLENLGTPQGEMRRRVAEASYFFGMGPWFHSDTDALSGGRKQLLALASALGAWFRYGRDDDWVLRGLDLEVRQGEVHALVGGNGCGKSTLLALIAGTRRAQRGEVRSAISAKAMLPQDPKALFAEERVDEELMEWAHIGGYGADEVQAMMGELGLADRAGLHPYDLSGGQRQMLALGKLLLVHPRLLLLDEPTKGLDRAAREHVAGMIEAARRDGVTVIVSTHDLAFVRRVADRVSLMFDGELACTEPVGEFFRNNLFYRP